MLEVLATRQAAVLAKLLCDRRALSAACIAANSALALSDIEPPARRLEQAFVVNRDRRPVYRVQALDAGVSPVRYSSGIGARKPDYRWIYCQRSRVWHRKRAGACAMAQDVDRILAKIKSGALPSPSKPPANCYAGKGTGRTCDACGNVITPNDGELEADLVVRRPIS
jgi:hypothetical protein